MIDPEIKHNIDLIKTNIKEINKLIEDLHKKGVEIQLTYDNNMNGKINTCPSLELWRALERVDYL